MVGVESSGLVHRSVEFRAIDRFPAVPPNGSRADWSSRARPDSARPPFGLSPSTEPASAASGCLTHGSGQAESVLAYAALADLLGAGGARGDRGVAGGATSRRRPGPVASERRRPHHRSAHGRRRIRNRFRPNRRRRALAGRHRRRSVARSVQSDGLTVRDPAAQRPHRRAGDGGRGPGCWRRDDMATSLQTRWHRANSCRAPEPRRNTCLDLCAPRAGEHFRVRRVRIFEISGGNPFYALELAHAMHVGSNRAQPSLPATLAGTDAHAHRQPRRGGRRRAVSRRRRGQSDGRAAGRGDSTPLSNAQWSCSKSRRGKGIVAIDGNVVRFSHPLLAQSVYTDARPARRRATHRSLAEVTVIPELKARHMALAASSADAETLKALDSAADGSAWSRAPPPQPN